MFRQEKTVYSHALGRDMRLRMIGDYGKPVLVFPTQDAMCDQFEAFGMADVIRGELESGKIRLFLVDTVDQESWSPKWKNGRERAEVQEAYHHHIADEIVPMIRDEIRDPAGRALALGCSLGATHAALAGLRRPDLFDGFLSLSGVYDAEYFWDGYMDDLVYANSPVHFLPNMPKDHPYIPLYNDRRMIFCVGTGAWEDEGIRTQRILENVFREKGISAWTDFWGPDVNHDWPWWKVQLRYFLPYLLGEQPMPV